MEVGDQRAGGVTLVLIRGKSVEATGGSGRLWLNANTLLILRSAG